MNFLDALKNGNNSEFQKEKETTFVRETKISVDENYINNTCDSEITCRTPELIDICEEFVSDSIMYDNPLLLKHHLGCKNFINEMLQLFQDNITVRIELKEDTESDSDDDLDLSDLYNYDHERL